MREPTTTAPPTGRLTPLLAPVASLGVVIAGCPACRLPVGPAGAPGLARALAEHDRWCPKRRPAPAEDDVCPRCGCEAELYRRAGGPCCGDCLAELHTTDLPIPATAPAAPPARPAAPVRLHGHRATHHAAVADAEQAVVA